MIFPRALWEKGARKTTAPGGTVFNRLLGSAKAVACWAVSDQVPSHLAASANASALVAVEGGDGADFRREPVSMMLPQVLLWPTLRGRRACR